MTAAREEQLPTSFLTALRDRAFAILGAATTIQLHATRGSG
jgi:hypothetical protein